MVNSQTFCDVCIPLPIVLTQPTYLATYLPGRREVGWLEAGWVARSVLVAEGGEVRRPAGATRRHYEKLKPAPIECHSLLVRGPSASRQSAGHHCMQEERAEHCRTPAKALLVVLVGISGAIPPWSLPLIWVTPSLI